MAKNAPRAQARTPLTDERVRLLASAAGCSPVTVVRALAGLPVRGAVGDRVRAVLLQEGLVPT